MLWPIISLIYAAEPSEVTSFKNTAPGAVLLCFSAPVARSITCRCVRSDTMISSPTSAKPFGAFRPVAHFSATIDPLRSTLASADRATSRQRHRRYALPRKERPQNKIRCPHFTNDVVFSRRIYRPQGRHRSDAAILQALYFGTQRLQQQRHRLDVAQPRRIHQRQRLFGQQCCWH